MNIIISTIRGDREIWPNDYKPKNKVKKNTKKKKRK